LKREGNMDLGGTGSTPFRVGWNAKYCCHIIPLQLEDEIFQERY